MRKSLLCPNRSQDLAVPLPRDRRLNRKVLAGAVAEREDPFIAADLVIRVCLRDRISKCRRQPLILHAYNGNA